METLTALLAPYDAALEPVGRQVDVPPAVAAKWLDLLPPTSPARCATSSSAHGLARGTGHRAGAGPAERDADGRPRLVVFDGIRSTQRPPGADLLLRG
jgi:hypothetical protein